MEISDTLDAYLDAGKMRAYDLISQVVTMSAISDEQLRGLLTAIESGTGYTERFQDAFGAILHACGPVERGAGHDHI